MPTATQLIATFELQVSDVTELSTIEELAILERVYQKVCSDRPWEFLKTPVSGTMSGSGVNGFYITTPTDFAYFAENFENERVIFVGTDYTPYQIVDFSNRRQYKDITGYAYLDLVNGKIYFTGTPASTTYEFDYIKFPATLTAGTSPIFPARFHDILVYLMASSNDVLQLSPKATSYKIENEILAKELLNDMIFWNANLQLN